MFFFIYISFVRVKTNKIFNLKTMFKCEFAQNCVFSANKNFNSSDTEGKYASFLDQFGNDVESFSKKKFLSHSKKLVEHWRRNKYHLNKKNILLSHSRENWNALSEEDKKLHSPFQTSICEGCKPKVTYL